MSAQDLEQRALRLLVALQGIVDKRRFVLKHSDSLHYMWRGLLNFVW